MNKEVLDKDGMAELDRSKMKDELMARLKRINKAMDEIGEQANKLTTEFVQTRDKLKALEFDELDLPPETEL